LATVTLFQPLQRSRLYERIVTRIQDLIAERHLAPGERLPGERELAEALSVSRQSVREALKILDYLGIAAVRPGEGTFVATTPPTPRDPSVYNRLTDRAFLLELVEARRLLEEQIVDLAVRRRTQEDLRAMEKFLAAREAELASGQHDVAGDLAFHELVAEATGNDVLLSVVRHLNEMWVQVREKTGRAHLSPHKALRFHRQLLTALWRRQPAQARRTIRRHLDQLRVEISNSAAAPAPGRFRR
jgi:GntR family transcriptional repressor for pyruvate dehydrogenase complex